MMADCYEEYPVLRTYLGGRSWLWIFGELVGG